MSIDVALNHRTSYSYDRFVIHQPHVIRLRPAPHTRSKVLSYTQRISPDDHFVNWQQDPFANYLSRIVFNEPTDHFEVEIDLIARMEAINPFDFFLEESAQEASFSYDAETASDLAPYMVKPKIGLKFREFLGDAPPRRGTMNDFIVALNQYTERAIGYVVRMEPGVQTAEETLTLCKGSCRDSGWLLVQALRHMGFAARFVSGYLIQLKPDVKPLDGPGGPEEDFTDLHAWAEVYLPGAGWVGLDPTSGLFAGEGHIPLACTPAPRSAAPISGSIGKCEVEFDFAMSVRRLNEPPRQTKPLSEQQWSTVMATGRAVDQRLEKGDVRLTVGGEPTFVSATNRDADEWTVGAVGPTKRYYADKFVRRLRDRFAPKTGALHYGQGKWYPGEQLPRWAFELHWREDGGTMWHDSALIAQEAQGTATIADAEAFMGFLCDRIEVPRAHAMPAYEDPVEFALREQNLPLNSTPATNKLSDPEIRRRLVRVFENGLGTPSAYVLPVQQAQGEAITPHFQTELWRTRRQKLYLTPGDSAAGLRLPLEALPIMPPGMAPQQFERDPFMRRPPLPQRFSAPPRFQTGREAEERRKWLESRRTSVKWHVGHGAILPEPQAEDDASPEEPSGGAVRTALAIEPRGGTLCIFLPPTQSVEGYLALLNAL